VALCGDVEDDGRVKAIADFSRHWVVDTPTVAAYITPQGGEREHESCIRALTDYTRAGEASTPRAAAEPTIRDRPEGQGPPDDKKSGLPGGEEGTPPERLILRGKGGTEVTLNVAPAVKSDGERETAEETSRRICNEKGIRPRPCLQVYQALQAKRPMPVSTALSSPRPKIYDGFIISTELDLLEVPSHA